jgi:hypothetical protein
VSLEGRAIPLDHRGNGARGARQDRGEELLLHRLAQRQVEEEKRQVLGPGGRLLERTDRELKDCRAIDEPAFGEFALDGLEEGREHRARPKLLEAIQRHGSPEQVLERLRESSRESRSGSNRRQPPTAALLHDAIRRSRHDGVERQ